MKKSEIQNVIATLRKSSNTILDALDSLTASLEACCLEMPSSKFATVEDVQAPTSISTDPDHSIALEGVRRVLAEKSRCGYADQIRGLILSRGVNTLSDVDPTEYETLLKEAEALYLPTDESCQNTPNSNKPQGSENKNQNIYTEVN